MNGASKPARVVAGRPGDAWVYTTGGQSICARHAQGDCVTRHAVQTTPRLEWGGNIPQEGSDDKAPTAWSDDGLCGPQGSLGLIVNQSVR